VKLIDKLIQYLKGSTRLLVIHLTFKFGYENIKDEIRKHILVLSNSQIMTFVKTIRNLLHLKGTLDTDLNELKWKNC